METLTAVLEGGEGLIIAVNEVIQRAGNHGVKEVVMGMAHRGRLNVLVNILGKNPADLFHEFEGKRLTGVGSGDVKYHQGFSSNVMTSSASFRSAVIRALVAFWMQSLTMLVRSTRD